MDIIQSTETVDIVWYYRITGVPTLTDIRGTTWQPAAVRVRLFNGRPLSLQVSGPTLDEAGRWGRWVNHVWSGPAAAGVLSGRGQPMPQWAVPFAAGERRAGAPDR
ncbi:hypothetical protein AB0A95_21580 [Micromonospora sp. NPDC049230]|uniref:hypothetical protein n=1 Tax=Micromonospora sp. NPDC049230 TaxID=3155502 RepID=UPI0033F4283B